MLKFHLINSSSNPIFKDLRIFVKQGINKNFADLFCVAGYKNNLVALQNNWAPHSIFVPHDIDTKMLNKLKALTKNVKVRWIQLSESLVNVLNELGNGNDLFVYYDRAALMRQSFVLDNSFNYVLCDSIQEPSNLGAIIRNAAAFNVKGLFVYNSASIYHPKVVRASAGNIFNLPIAIVDDLNQFIKAVKTKKIQLIGLMNDKQSKSIDELTQSGQQLTGLTFILGNEGHGISSQLLKNCDQMLRIDINNKVESLNVACTSAILFYELSKRC